MYESEDGLYLFFSEFLSYRTRLSYIMLMSSDPTTDSGAFRALREIGKEIVETVKPKAVVVLSAHWQSSRDTIYVNTAESTDLIYDFSGFPSFMYKETYPHVGSRDIASKVIDVLQSKGIKAQRS